jgi:FkbM family methyltransferase
VDHSQYQEQIYIQRFFGSTKGTFLDVGAANGVTFSNVYQLLLDGWSGISVEPETQTFRELIHHYKQFDDRSELVIAVIDTQERFVTFYENGQLSTTSPEHMARWDEHTRKNNATWRPITHRTITLSSLLSHYKDRNIDFISVDIEGQNIDVVCSTDWRLAPSCKLLCIEHDQNWDPIVKSLEPYGYSVYEITPVNILLSREL